MTEATALPEDRPLGRAVLNGWRKCCPNCGSGPLLRGYLKVRESCPVCGEELFHQRADDGPAYLTILIVGHLLAPALLISYNLWHPDPWLMSAVLSVACVALSLFLLPRMKGVMVAIQWAKRMHGFGGAPKDAVMPGDQ